MSLSHDMPGSAPAPSSAPVAEPPPIPAASMIVVRAAQAAGQGGFEVLLMERPADASSFASALVFPGGKVEADDAAIAIDSGFESLWQRHVGALLGEQHPQQTVASLYGAALRETVEEVGLLWPASPTGGDPAQVASLRQALVGGQPWQQACQGGGLAGSLEGIQPFSRWITPLVPNVRRKRFDTWFFVAELPEGQQAQADGSEAQNLVWATPRAVLERFIERECVLVPPQIMTLAHLSRFADIGALMRHAESQRPYCVAPVSEFIEGNRVVYFPGDDKHPEAERVMPGPTRLMEFSGQFRPLAGFEALWA